MENTICNFKQNMISFQIGKDSKMMINATDMAKPFNKKANEFISKQDTQDFIRECLIEENANLLGIEDPNELIYSIKGTGTWMHRILAIKFAAWLNPAFELWVYKTIDNLLYGAYREKDSSFERTIRLQTEADYLKNMPAEERTGADFQRFLDISLLLNREKSLRKNLTTQGITNQRDMFEIENQ